VSATEVSDVHWQQRMQNDFWIIRFTPGFFQPLGLFGRAKACVKTEDGYFEQFL
jgi:hypothetical protein